MAWQAYNKEFGTLGAIALKASGAVTTSAAAAAVVVGSGTYQVKVVVSALDVVNNDEQYLIVIEGNTLAAASTYTEVGNLVLGALEVTGRAADGVVGTYMVPITYTGGDKIRIHTYVIGTTPSITFSADVLPLVSVE